ncbi:MAG: nitrite reductase small subunit NirD [Magnetococcales bacterium]|nr:nitrite reductase small subunit NirD [Magnetococcales bacterium]
MSTWHRVGRIDDIPRQGSRVVKSGRHGDVALFRSVDDHVFALADRCPHRGGPLSAGMVHGHKVTCPLHGWTLGLENGEALGADEGCAGRFAVRVEGEELFLELPDGHE